MGREWSAWGSREKVPLDRQIEQSEQMSKDKRLITTTATTKGNNNHKMIKLIKSCGQSNRNNTRSQR